MKLSSVALLFGAITLASCFPVLPTEVIFFGETHCPYCRLFMGGTLNKTLENIDVHPYFTYEYVPWGNAYYILPGSGWSKNYSSYNRYLWAKQCMDTIPPPPECTSGEIVAQHGQVELYGNAVQSCAKYIYPQSWLELARFYHCFEVQRDSSRSAIAPCAKASGYDPARLEMCADTREWMGYARADAIRTLQRAPLHVGVPYVSVNFCGGAAPDDLREAICDAYPGPVTREGCPNRGPNLGARPARKDLSL